MDIDYLKTLKYAELRKLAKQNGVKANLKADKIIAALLQKNSSKDVPTKTDGKVLFTPVQKPTPKVRLVTPNSFITPKMGRNVTPGCRVVNMPKSATPHPRKSTGAKPRISSGNRQRVKATTPKTTEEKVELKRRRTSPRIAAQETTKQSQDEPEAKRVRRSTFEIEKDSATTEKSHELPKVKQVVTTTCNIPRFSAFLANKKKINSSATKDWSKVHQKQFEKMESIDDYLARKRKRTEELSSSVKKAKTLTERTKNAVCAMKAYRTPPASASKKPKKSIIPPPSFQSPKVFVPKASSTKNMNVQFDKTVKQTSSVFVFKGNSARKSVGAGDARKSLGTGLTPFKLNTTTPGPKPVFDLKASLAKPLNYKPYTGKLSNNKKLNATQAKENLKKPKVTTMAERRKMASKQRSQRKNNALNARRGIKV